MVTTGLSWVASCTEDGSEHEIFFRAQDVVDALRDIAKFHVEKAAGSVESVKRVTHAGLALLLTTEADKYDCAIMQALLEHGSNDVHGEAVTDG